MLTMRGELAGQPWQLRLRDGLLSGEPGVVRVVEDAVDAGELVQVGVTGHTVPVSLDYPATIALWLAEHPGVTVTELSADAGELDGPSYPDDAVS